MLLLDGSLNALLAAAMWHEGRMLEGTPGPNSGLAWVLGSPAMQQAAGEMARGFGLEVVARSDGGSGRSQEAASSIVVLAGAVGAARLGCSRMVWPVHAGSPDGPEQLDLDLVAESIDRATLVGRLASLDARREIEVQVPFVDFNDRQIADLVLDMGLDPSMCWWASRGGAADDNASDSHAIGERRRWQLALREAGSMV